MKRVIVYFLSAVLALNFGVSYSFAQESRGALDEPKKIMVYIKPDISITYNNVEQIFRDAQGDLVNPIIYNGAAYLSLRSVAKIMNEPIEWDAASKTVFIGRTLSNPTKTTAGAVILKSEALNSTSGEAISKIDTTEAIKAEISSEGKPDRLEKAYLKSDLLIMYDFEIQYFLDYSGNQIAPIMYKGSTYLPLSAISQMMNKLIEWDGSTNNIKISSGEDTGESETDQLSATAKNLKSLFEREEILYYEATAKTTKIKETISLEEKQIIADAISENYRRAQILTREIKEVNTSGFTMEELAAYDKIAEFAESTEYYILVLENIAYFAASDTDYSMLAEPFMYFAVQSQNRMLESRNLVEEIIN